MNKPNNKQSNQAKKNSTPKYAHDSLRSFQGFLLLRDYSAKTLKDYAAKPRMIGEYFDADPASLTESEVRDYLLYVRTEKKVASTTMRQIVAGLKAFYQGHLKVEPAWEVFGEVRVKDRYKLPTVLLREEVAAVLAQLVEDRFRTGRTLIYTCGLRIGEAVSLQVRDIDSKAQRLHIRQGKGGKDRYVPLNLTMLADLRRFYKRHRHPKYLFPGMGRGWKLTAQCRKEEDPAAQAKILLERARQSKTHMSAMSVRGAFNLALASSSVKKKATPHTLRHSYATHLLESGVSLRHVSAYLGHASLNETVVYIHLTQISEEQTLRALEELHPPRHR